MYFRIAHMPNPPAGLIDRLYIAEKRVSNALRELVKPPDIVVGRLKLYCDSFIFYLLSSVFCLFFVSYCPRWLNGTQPKPASCSKVSTIYKMHVRNLGYPLPLKSGAPNHLFSTTSQLNGNFNGYLRNET